MPRCSAYILESKTIPTPACASQALNLDSDSNLWVAGGPALTRLFTDPAGITDSATVIAATPSFPPLKLSTAASSIDIDLMSAPGLAAACSDPTDDCCTTGYWDAGIAISGHVVYVANICETGLVRFRVQDATLKP